MAEPSPGSVRDEGLVRVIGVMLGAPRVIFVSSLDGNLPRALSKVHAKYKTP